MVPEPTIADHFREGDIGELRAPPEMERVANDLVEFCVSDGSQIGLLVPTERLSAYDISDTLVLDTPQGKVSVYAITPEAAQEVFG